MSRNLVVVATLMLLVLAIAPAAMAESLQKDLQFTVNGPLTVPNGVLSPGTYELRFLDPEFSIVALSRQDGSSVGEYRVMRTDRSMPTDQPKIVVGAAADGSAALMEWFYPGESSGYQLTYDQKPGMIARKNAHTLDGK